MLRPKSAGGAGAGRSFLDDLLGTDPVDSIGTNSSSTTNKARKSVRFFDDDDDDSLPTSATSSRSNRPHSSTLDSLLSANSSRSSTAETSSNRPKSSDLTSSRTATSSKSDWLGLSSEKEDSASRRSNTLDQQSTRAQNPPASTGTKTTSTTEPDDWITAGLRARASKPAPTPPAAEPAESNRPSFLQSQPVAPKIQQQDPPPPSQPPPSARPWNPRTVDNSTSNTSGHLINAPAASTEPTLPQLPPQQQQPSGAPTSDEKIQPTEVKESKVVTKNEQVHQEKEILLSTLADVPETSSNSAVFLQTKLRILTLEKSFLEQTLAQMKENQREELQSMVSLYDEQMRMTSEMYKRHEEMIQDERDRRIVELKSQLEHSQSELEEVRFRHQQRLAAVEAEWAADVARIRNAHSSSAAAATEAHEEAMARLEARLKAEAEVGGATATSADLLRSHSRSVSELLAKWEASAHAIETLQQSVVARQEDLLLRQQALDPSGETAQKVAVDLELQWKDFLANMEAQRNSLETILKTGQLEQAKAEQAKLETEKEKLESERRELEELKGRFAQEVRDWRTREGEAATRWRDERSALRNDVQLFEERRAALEALYNERKRAVEEEAAKLGKQEAEIEKRKAELEAEKEKLARERLSLEADRQQLTSMQELFSREKEQLATLATNLAKRADELENLSEVALREKLDGIAAIDEMDSLQTELDGKLANIEDSAGVLRKEEARLRSERANLEQQWAALQSLRQSIVCNLCGSSLGGRGVQQNQHPTAGFEESLMQLSNYSIALASFSQGRNRNGSSGSTATQSQNPLFQSLLSRNGSGVGDGAYFMNNNNGNYSWTTANQQYSPVPLDQDQKLLFWQMTGQQEDASLAEETRFLRLIRMKK